MKSTTSAIVLSALFAVSAAVRIGDYDPNVQALVEANSDIDLDSRSENEFDNTYKNNKEFALTDRDIIDADGDGVEDNVKKTQAELDKFRKMVYGPAVEDLHNTKNGELPGHVRKGEDSMPENKADPTSVTTNYHGSAAEVSKEEPKEAPKEEKAVAEKPKEEPKAAEKAAVPKAADAPAEKPAQAKAPDSAAQKPQPPQSLSDFASKTLAPDFTGNVDVNAENLGQIAEGIEISDSYNDNEYVQTANTLRGKSGFEFFIDEINSPEDLQFLQVGKTRKAWKRRSTDMDGDGVEDNEKFSHYELDNFYDPLVFGVAEDINNTHHGNLPGHKQLEFTIHQVEPVNHWQDIVQGSWEIK